MKRSFTLIMLCLLLGAPAAEAFLYEVPMMNKEDIKAASDADLVNAYIEAKIELDASRTFHSEAGFTSPKEYNRHKELLNYIVKLRLEMQLRELDVPPIDEWLK